MAIAILMSRDFGKGARMTWIRLRSSGKKGVINNEYLAITFRDPLGSRKTDSVISALRAAPSDGNPRTVY